METTRATPNELLFTLHWEGTMGSVRRITENYRLDEEGLHYAVTLDPPPQAGGRCVIPLIETDGLHEACHTVDGNTISVTYRERSFVVRSPTGEITLTEERNTNRNATYRTAVTPAGTASAGTASAGVEILLTAAQAQPTVTP